MYAVHEDAEVFCYTLSAIKHLLLHEAEHRLAQKVKHRLALF